MKMIDKSQVSVSGPDILNCYDRTLRDHLSSLRSTFDGSNFATVDGLLQEVRVLESRQHVQSRFCRMASRLQSLTDFLAMYSPVLDLMVQFDPNPSVLVWGSLKCVLQARTPVQRNRSSNTHVDRRRPFRTRSDPSNLSNMHWTSSQTSSRRLLGTTSFSKTSKAFRLH